MRYFLMSILFLSFSLYAFDLDFKDLDNRIYSSFRIAYVFKLCGSNEDEINNIRNDKLLGISLSDGLGWCDNGGGVYHIKFQTAGIIGSGIFNQISTECCVPGGYTRYLIYNKLDTVISTCPYFKDLGMIYDVKTYNLPNDRVMSVNVEKGENDIWFLIGLVNLSKNISSSKLHIDPCNIVNIVVRFIFKLDNLNPVSLDMPQLMSNLMPNLKKDLVNFITFYPDSSSLFIKQLTDSDILNRKAFVEVPFFDTGSIHGLEITKASLYLNDELLIYEDIKSNSYRYDTKPLFTIFSLFECLPSANIIKWRLESERAQFNLSKSFIGKPGQVLHIKKNFILSGDTSNALNYEPYDTFLNRIKPQLIADSIKSIHEQHQYSENAKKQENAKNINEIINNICDAYSGIELSKKRIEEEKLIAARSGVYDKVAVYDATQYIIRMERFIPQWKQEYLKLSGKVFNDSQCINNK